MEENSLMSLSQEQAIDRLQELVNEIQSLKKGVAFSEAHTRWLTNALSLTEEIFGKGSRIYLSLAHLTWCRTGSFYVDPLAQETWDYNEAIKQIHHESYLEQLNTAIGLLKAGIDQVNLYGIGKVYHAPDASKEVGGIIKIINLAETKLRKTVRELPKTEKEIQDRFEDLLVATDIKYLREQDRIVYSSKTYQPDFSFTEINAVLEMKLCDKAGREKAIISEINDDILAYKTKYPNVIFLIYDLGHIRDVNRFKEDVESQDGVIVLVVKH
jgi:hypothetical protein